MEFMFNLKYLKQTIKSYTCRKAAYRCILRIKIAKSPQYSRGYIQFLALRHQLSETEIWDLRTKESSVRCAKQIEWLESRGTNKLPSIQNKHHKETMLLWGVQYGKSQKNRIWEIGIIFKEISELYLNKNNNIRIKTINIVFKSYSKQSTNNQINSFVLTYIPKKNINILSIAKQCLH